MLFRKFSFQPDLLTFVEASVKQIIRCHAYVHFDEIDTNRTFANLGFNILEQTRLIIETENHFGFKLTQKEFLEVDSIFDLVCVINKYRCQEFMLANKQNNDVSVFSSDENQSQTN